MDTTQDARQSLGGGRDMEEEMQHVLQFLDTSLITPPSGNELVTQHPQMQRSTQPQQLQQRQQQPSPALLREMATLQENEVAGGYNELGEVIDLLGSLDANDTDPALLQQQQVYNVVGAVGLNPATLSRPTAPADVALRRVQLPRSTSVSSSHSGVDNISPVGLLNGPSMSPATINWLQTLVPSTSTESLTGLISPATLYSAGGGSASGIGGVVGGVGSSAQADGAKCGGGDLARTPSCEIIDWKAYNESCADKTQKESAKWRVIPQHGPHAEQAASPNGGNSTGGKLPPGAAASASAAGPTELSAQQQMHLAARKMAEEKSKRKALVSPEYVQYGNTVSLTPSSMPRDPAGGVKMEPGVLQYATKVPEPTGRRPFKKSLHQTTASVIEANSQEPQPQQQPPVSTASSTDGKDDSCKCVSCANPFVPMAREGIDIQLMVRDVCLMQYLSKIKDMQELLDSTVSYECCEGGGGVVQVKHTVENGFACPHCGAHFTYSWCNNRLCPDAKKPRRHCAKCRRCQSSGSATGAKTRAVVPNPVRRDSESTANNDEGDKQNGGQLFGAVNPAVEGAVRDENSDANYSSKPGGEEGADDDSCKMQ
ncbi:hypothetical protein PF007_g7075 [Phytophthora fragariae]|uniref:Uncharacterized protein n=1 Tax=Phytophthora fragariae TaxID=53985 RepID=A0A6A3FPU0_9STRA|nr:hypothetical protein PF003_g32435 [Phytophthora fragariae]KAE8947033.1 hypothetical protein PF009_g3347 [Phytophthora fragariae]KAE9123384.1 hypothetical protein PF007_g7075 [Phytophthora fragariae]KAE9222325.1 hypothetical protein PF004_g12818 [Phytophthora fragariae]